MEISKNWKEWLKWFLLAALTIFILIPLNTFLDTQLISNNWAIIIKLIAIGIILAFIDMFLRQKLGIQKSEVK